MHWLFRLFFKIYLFNTACMKNTDIGVIYEHEILLLQNASILSSKITEKAEALVKLPHKFEYPIAVAYDPDRDVAFVSDANNKDTKIFSLSLNSKEVIVNSLIPRQKQSLIDAVVYDPVKNQLLWTDSFKHGIYYADLSTLNSTKNSKLDPVLVTSNEVFQPRGIAIDYCNRMIYWSERQAKNPVIKKYSLIDKSIEIIKTASNGTFFQGMNFNFLRNELIWAETSGDDERNSSCTIVTKSLENGVENIIGSFNHCYPFSLTSDHDFIYWSDWSRSGIMRLQRGGVSEENLVKLLNTPSSKTDQGHHNGAFGIVNLENYYALNKSSCVFHVEKNDSFTKINHTDDKTLLQSAMTSDSQDSNGSFQDSDVFYNLRLIIILLAFGCFFFLTTTLLLLGRIMCSRDGCLWNVRKRLMKISDKPGKLSPKRIKPHRRFQSKLKSLDGELCSRDNDGIKIDIEDCCQMTLCDTPCYTSLKKAGKGYKLASNSANVEDKEELLQNIGTI